MASELSINERCAASDYRRVSHESAEEAESFSLAASALKALNGGLSNEAREEIFTAIRKHQGISEPLDLPGKLAMLHTLGKAEELIVSYEDRASSIARSAEETAQQVELHGLPGSSE